MSSIRYDPRNPSTPQSIPLQDLSRPPDSQDIAAGERTLRRSRSLLENSHLLSGGRIAGRRYERLTEDPPSPADRNALHPTSHMTMPLAPEQTQYAYDDDELSPVAMEEHAAFQAAMGSVGLSFEAPERTSRQTSSMSTPPKAQTSHLGIITKGEGLSPFAHLRRAHTTESESYVSPTDTDTTPLTDVNHLQPISGAQTSSSPGQLNGRSSFQSIRFADGTSPGARLGDDLLTAEGGLMRSGSTLGTSPSHSARTRSLSPSAAGSPLSRAGSVVRKMSQRVVNLSNEPEVVEQSIRRKSSLKQARLEGPPSFPAMTEYAHDEPARTLSPLEKDPPLSFAGRARGKWQQHVNPLKGKTLGIFPPENKIRVKLCEMLVHPVTEPIILVLIVFQTILLAIDSAPNYINDPRSKRWGSTWIDYALVALFTVYTLEIVGRVIVSGFIFNPQEYSTIDRQLGLKNAIIDKSRKLFAPERRSSIKKTPSSIEPQQPSILRSFTGMQAQEDQPGHTRQQQRVRLARRAFLRHSFNRLDFLAVVSFWISFGLSIAQIESDRHVYVFRMLSCMRILRLLGLTSGTSVC